MQGGLDLVNIDEQDWLNVFQGRYKVFGILTNGFIGIVKMWKLLNVVNVVENENELKYKYNIVS